MDMKEIDNMINFLNREVQDTLQKREERKRKAKALTYLKNQTLNLKKSVRYQDKKLKYTAESLNEDLDRNGIPQYVDIESVNVGKMNIGNINIDNDDDDDDDDDVDDPDIDTFVINVEPHHKKGRVITVEVPQNGRVSDIGILVANSLKVPPFNIMIKVFERSVYESADRGVAIDSNYSNTPIAKYPPADFAFTYDIMQRGGASNHQITNEDIQFDSFILYTRVDGGFIVETITI